MIATHFVSATTAVSPLTSYKYIQRSYNNQQYCVAALIRRPSTYLVLLHHVYERVRDGAGVVHHREAVRLSD